LQDFGSVHAHVSARTSRSENVDSRENIAADPMKIACVGAGRNAFGIAHGGKELAGAMVFQVLHEGIVGVVELFAGGKSNDREEPQSVGYFVQTSVQKIGGVTGRVVIETVIPMDS